MNNLGDVSSVYCLIEEQSSYSYELLSFDASYDTVYNQCRFAVSTTASTSGTKRFGEGNTLKLTEIYEIID